MTYLDPVKTISCWLQEKKFKMMTFFASFLTPVKVCNCCWELPFVRVPKYISQASCGIIEHWKVPQTSGGLIENCTKFLPKQIADALKSRPNTTTLRRRLRSTTEIHDRFTK